MSADTFRVFDDWIETTNGSPASFYSSSAFCEGLGLLDQIAFEVEAAQGPGFNPELEIQLTHSADGMNWMDKAAAPELPAYVLDAGNPDLNVRVGLDDGTTPTLRYVQFKLTISAAGGATAKVRLVATINDVRQTAFSRRVKHTIKELAESNPCKEMVQGGRRIDNSEYDTNVWYWAKRVWEAKGENQSFVKKTGAEDYQLRHDASLCITEDGHKVVSRRGKKSVVVDPYCSSGGGGGDPSSGC
jgi:hypothetical protein